MCTPEDTLSLQVQALITCNAFRQLCAQHLVHPAPIATAVIHLWNSTERGNTLTITSSHLSSAFHSEPHRLWDFRRQWDQTYHKIILRTSSKQSHELNTILSLIYWDPERLTSHWLISEGTRIQTKPTLIFFQYIPRNFLVFLPIPFQITLLDNSMHFTCSH